MAENIAHNLDNIDTEQGTQNIPTKEKVTYGFGDFGNGFMFDLGQSYLMHFYTDVAGISAAAAAGVFSLTKIFDAFMDPLEDHLLIQGQQVRAVNFVLL
jgi:GPH family glycoside/pentoside/hexuronide:cation symporter